MSTNILHISRTMGIGGAEKIVYQLCHAMSRTFKRTFVASSGGEFVSDLETSGFVHVNLYDIETKNPYRIIKNYKLLKEVVNMNNIDIIHVHHRMGLLYAQLIKLFVPSVRIIYTAHNIFKDKLLFYKLLLTNVETIAIGESVENSLQQDVKLTNDIRVIYNCVSPNKTTEKLYDERIVDYTGHKLLFVGRLTKQKGVGYLIKAIAKLKNVQCKLFIVGDGEDREILEDLTKSLGIESKVVFLGFQKNPSSYIAISEFMIMPSLWEGLPLTPIEAFMLRKTLVATKIPGITDIINNNNGLLVEAKNVEELASSINYLIENPLIREQKEKCAYETYLEKFSYETFVSNYHDLYFKEKK
ncbi:glycosyltransferase family 4 protein [Streptococcus fryi]